MGDIVRLFRLRVLSRFALAAASLAAGWGASRPAAACDGTTERVVGYSLNDDAYVSEERSLDGLEPARYVTRSLTTDEVVDFVTCRGPGACSTTQALGVRACSFRPVPGKAPEKISLTKETDSPARSEVWFDGIKGPMPLLRVRSEGTLGLRSGVQTGSSVVLFLKETMDEDRCPRTRERAVLLNEESPEKRPEESEPGLREIDLTGAPEPGTEARVLPPPSAEPIAPLAQAAQAAAATHLDALAACWAQEALWMMQAQHDRAAERTRLRDLPEPDIEISDVKVIAGGHSAAPEPDIEISDVKVIVGGQ